MDWTIPKDKYEAKMFKTQGDDDLQDREEEKVNGVGKPNKKASNNNNNNNSVSIQKKKIKKEESSEESDLGVWYF